MLRKNIKLVIPHTGIEGEPVNQYEGMSAPRYFIIEAGSVDVGEAVVSRHRCRSLLQLEDIW